MPKNLRIIERATGEVNGSSWTLSVRNGHCASRVRLLSCLLLAALSFTGCASDEQRAERLYDEAQGEVQAGQLEAAIEIYERIIDRYPRTATAREARRQIVLYEGLEDAVRSYPVRVARDLIVETARGIEKYRRRQRAWPRELEQLVPDDLPQLPVDPWGRALLYQVKPRGRGYILACLGADGEPGGKGDDADWFVENGSFVLQPSRRMM